MPTIFIQNPTNFCKIQQFILFSATYTPPFLFFCTQKHRTGKPHDMFPRIYENPSAVIYRRAHRRGAFLFTAPSMPQNYAHHISPAFSKIRTSFKKAIAFSRPSLGDISPSSCSMEITPSYPTALSMLIISFQTSLP